MINNFEDFTYELTEQEKSLLPMLIKGLSNKSSEEPIKASDIVSKMNKFNNGTNLPKMHDVRLRKMVNYIRTNGLLPIIATSKGYFVSYDENIILEQIESLTQRAKSIEKCANGLYKFLNNNNNN